MKSKIFWLGWLVLLKRHSLKQEHYEKIFKWRKDTDKNMPAVVKAIKEFEEYKG